MRLLVLLALVALPALAEEPVMGMVGSNGQPLSVNADNLEWRQVEKAYVAKGNAVVTQGETSLTADEIVAHYIDKESGGTAVSKVEANGHVLIKSAGQEASGDKGVYDLSTQRAVLTGNDLKFSAGSDVVTARDSLEYWQKENKAIAKGDARARRDDQVVAADVLTAELEKDKAGKTSIRRINAVGSVIIATKDEIARGDRGVYDLVKKSAQLDGHVRITKGQNQLNGGKADMDMNSGVSQLTANEGSQVKALMQPKDMETHGK